MSGKITVRHNGSVKKNMYIFSINNLYNSINKIGLIINIFYSFLFKKYFAFLKYANGSFICINLIHGLTVGDYIFNNFFFLKNFSNSNLGSFIFLKNVKQFSIFSNLIIFKKKKKSIALSSGTFCVLLKKHYDASLAYIMLPSGLKKFFNLNSFCMLGRNAHVFSKYIYVGKAGDNRKINIRPTTRGVAMNPCDHPHGGRTKTNQPEVSPWG